MASPTNKFKYESLQDRETITRYLEALREGFENGHLRLAWKDSVLELEPEGLIRLDVEAKQKDDQMKLNIKMSWKSPKALESREPLSIQSEKGES